jgi:deoxyribonuclease IV
MVRSGTRRIGIHTSIAGGIHKSLERARRLRCNTLQIFSHNPRGWAARHISNAELSAFVELKTKYGMSPVVIHTSYLINLASKKRILRKKSVKMLEYELDVADKIGAAYVVLHTGSASGEDPKTARKRVVESLMEISNRGKRMSRLLLENTAGQRGDMTSKIHEIAEIIEKVPAGLISGMCLDTCHAFSAGYDIRNEKGINALSDEINDFFDRDMVRLLHLNDSKGPLGAGLDRHAHIGKGEIGAKGIKRFLLHPRFNEIPIILETPKKSEEDDIVNLSRVRKLLGTRETSGLR